VFLFKSQQTDGLSGEKVDKEDLCVAEVNYELFVEDVEDWVGAGKGGLEPEEVVGVGKGGVGQMAEIDFFDGAGLGEGEQVVADAVEKCAVDVCGGDEAQGVVVELGKLDEGGVERVVDEKSVLGEYVDAAGLA